jgi:hypothetical protein
MKPKVFINNIVIFWTDYIIYLLGFLFKKKYYSITKNQSCAIKKLFQMQIHNKHLKGNSLVSLITKCIICI